MKPTLCPLAAVFSMLAASPAPAALIAQWGLEEGSGSTTTEAVTTTASAAFGTGVT